MKMIYNIFEIDNTIEMFSFRAIYFSLKRWADSKSPPHSN